MEVEVNREYVEVYEFDEGDDMYLEYYSYIFGILHFQWDLSSWGIKGLKNVALFMKDIDVGAFSECILDG